MRRTVVKLGGSTADQAERTVWIEALAGSSFPIVIVPGGGPFANQIRSAQKRMRFSDTAAHAMAILAMDQFGHVILDRHQRFAAARSLDDIEQALRNRRIPVWLPSLLATQAPDIPASWDITSDALAAWLAGKIGAAALLLIKQTGAFSEGDQIGSLAAKGIVDAGLASMLPSSIEFYLASPDDAPTASELLSSGRLPGTRMRLTGLPARESA